MVGSRFWPVDEAAQRFDTYDLMGDLADPFLRTWPGVQGVGAVDSGFRRKDGLFAAHHFEVARLLVIRHL